MTNDNMPVVRYPIIDWDVGCGGHERDTLFTLCYILYRLSVTLWAF